MKAKLLFLLLSFCTALSIRAQNLVLNPGFEEGTIPTSSGQFGGYVTNWTENACQSGGVIDANGGRTPDLYDQRSTVMPTPLVFAGNINPHSGKRLVGFCGNFAEGRYVIKSQEMIKGKLVCNLKQGTYTVSFFSRPTASYQGVLDLSNNKLEVVLLKGIGCQDEKIIFTTTAINNQNGWMSFSQTFTLSAADEAKGYRWLAFRHIKSGTPTHWTRFEKAVFMDDVSLTGGNDMVFPPETYTICEGQSITTYSPCSPNPESLTDNLTISPMEGVSYTYDPTASTPIILSPGTTTTYTLTCNQGDCIKQKLITVIVTPAPETFRHHTLNCQDPPLSLTLCDPPNVFVSARSISDPGSNYIQIQGNLITFTQPWAGYYEVICRDPNGCLSKTYVIINRNIFVTDPPVAVPVCAGEEYIFEPCPGGTATFNNITGVRSLGNGQYALSASTTTSFKYYCSPGDPCLHAKEIVLVVTPVEELPDEYYTILCGETFGIDPLVCPGGQCEITYEDGVALHTFVMDPTMVTVFTPKAFTRYTLVCRDANGCITKRKNIYVDVTYNEVFGSETSIVICDGGTVNVENPCPEGTIIKVEPEIPFSGAGAAAALSFQPKETGLYRFYCLGPDGCITIYTYSIYVDVAEKYTHKVLCLTPGTMILLDPPCPSGSWTHTGTGGTITPGPGFYTYECRDLNGCITERFHYEIVNTQPCVEREIKKRCIGEDDDFYAEGRPTINGQTGTMYLVGMKPEDACPYGTASVQWTATDANGNPVTPVLNGGGAQLFVPDFGATGPWTYRKICRDAAGNIIKDITWIIVKCEPPSSGEGQMRAAPLNTTKARSGSPEVLLMPNPSNGSFEVKIKNLRSSLTEEISVTIMDALGRQVYARKLTADAFSNSVMMTLPESARSGLYLINVQGTNVSYTGRLSIIR
jgi:hypothetical protein